MNKVILIGNLTKDPEHMSTTSGVSVCRLTLAVQRKFSGQDGEREADFINIVTWRGLADNCHKFLKKGKKCAVIGEIQTRSYDAQDGTKRYVTEVVASEVEFLSAKDQTDGGSQEDAPTAELQPIDNDDDLPF